MIPWEAQLRKGCLELAILAAISQKRAYGLDLIERLERSGVVVTEGTIYPLLSRLREEGLLKSEWEESISGHPRRYYSLTPSGRRRAEAMAEAWDRLVASIEELTKQLVGGRNAKAR